MTCPANLCPKWHRCSAAICPLQPDVGAHLPGERVCLYARELAKPGGRDRLREAIPAEMVEAITQATPGLIVRHRALKSALEVASKSPSKLKQPSQVGVAA